MSATTDQVEPRAPTPFEQEIEAVPRFDPVDVFSRRAMDGFCVFDGAKLDDPDDLYCGFCGPSDV